jgi:hypothetical protein
VRDTIELAREAGADTLMYWDIEKLKRFEELVRADEREACAKVCDDYDVKYDVCSSDTAESIATAIRARGNT